MSQSHYGPPNLGPANPFYITCVGRNTPNKSIKLTAALVLGRPNKWDSFLIVLCFLKFLLHACILFLKNSSSCSIYSNSSPPSPHRHLWMVHPSSRTHQVCCLSRLLFLVLRSQVTSSFILSPSLPPSLPLCNCHPRCEHRLFNFFLLIISSYDGHSS